MLNGGGGRDIHVNIRESTCIRYMGYIRSHIYTKACEIHEYIYTELCDIDGVVCYNRR